MRRAAHIDDNQPAIVSALQAAGCSTQSLAAVGLGVPDLLVGFAGVNILLEIKNREGLDGEVARGKILTPDQKKFHGFWKGQIAIVYTPQDALQAVKDACTGVVVTGQPAALPTLF